MAKFCVKCRAALDADAKFCDACGEPVRAPRATHAAQPGQARSGTLPGSMPSPAASSTLAAAPIDINWRKVGLWGSVGLGVLVMVGGVSVFLALPPSLPSAVDIETLINANPVKVASATCLNNFDYGKDPVTVSGFDANTQLWMAVLTKAGLYTPPQSLNNNTIFGGGMQYSHTAEGNKRIHNGKLCFADGLSVVSVQLDKPVKLDKQWRAQGTYRYAYRHADGWIQTPEAQRAAPALFADLPKTNSVALVKGEHGWELDNGSAYGYATNGDALNSMANSIGSGLGQRALGANDGTGDEAGARSGLFGKLRAMVSGLFGSSSVLVGKWRADNSQYGTLEFTRDSALLQGAPVPVVYEKDGGDDKRIRVKIKDGTTFATVELIDDDHFYVSFGFGRTRFHRVG
ncbi:hypothetical protein bAD24_I01900 [Burkholderia sp. AD24]|nr:hypothetical protein bAD24_I01900 [Burkholderia sp. AD24]